MSDFADVAAELSAAVRGDANLPPEVGGITVPPAESNPPEASEPITPEADAEPGATETSDSFTGIDPETLPAEAKDFYKSLLADYTRKTQEAAPYRKLGDELGMQPEELREVAEFYRNLNTDPNYALQVHAALSQSLQQAGYSVGEANALANQQMAQATPSDSYDSMGDVDFGPDPRDAQLQELLSWKSEMERTQQVQSLAASLQRQEMAIRQSHPDYSDTDIERIYNLAPSHENNLAKAEEVYSNWKQGVIASYLDQKAQVPSSAPVSTGPAQQPQAFADLNAADAAARIALAQAIAEGRA